MQCIARLNDNDLHLLKAFAAGRSFSARVPIVSPDSKTLNPNPVPYLRLAARKCESIYRRIYIELDHTSQWHAFAGAFRVLAFLEHTARGRDSNAGELYDSLFKCAQLTWRAAQTKCSQSESARSLLTLYCAQSKKDDSIEDIPRRLKNTVTAKAGEQSRRWLRFSTTTNSVDIG